MSNPLHLVVSFDENGSPVESWEPITDAERDQRRNDRTDAAILAAVRADLDAASDAAAALADQIDANTATPDQQRHALAECLRGLVRLNKLMPPEEHAGESLTETDHYA